MAERRRIELRPQVSQQLPEIQTASGGSRHAEQLGRLYHNLSSFIGEQFTRPMVRSRAEQLGSLAGSGDEPPEFQNPGTEAGRAYNAAATQAYTAQLETQALAKANELSFEFGHDPAALQQQMDSARAGFESELDDPLIPAFRQIWQRQQFSAMTEAFKQQRRQLADERTASANKQVESRVNSIERLAHAAAEDPRAARMLIEEQSDLEALLLQYGPQGEFEWEGETFEADAERAGVFSLEGIQQVLAEAEDRMLVSRVIGAFEDTSDPVAFRDRFAESFRDPDTGEFRDNPSTGLTRQQHDRLLGRMDQEIRALQQGQNAAASDLRDQVRDAERLLERGYTPPQEDLAQLRFQVRASGDPDLSQQLAEAEQVFDFHQSISSMNPGELAQVTADMRADINERGRQTSPQEIRLLDHAESFLDNMRTGVERDPLGWANRVGLQTVQPLDFSSPEAMQETVQNRRGQSHSVAEHYGVAPQMLTRDEAAMLSTSLQESETDGQVRMLSALTDSFGSDTPRVLRQISDDVPIQAHVGGLMAMNDAHMRTARRALRGKQALDAGNELLSQSVDRRPAVEDVIGDSAYLLPNTRANIISTAEALYAEGALREGLTPDQHDGDLWERSLHEAAGALYSNGRRIAGGFGDWNGHRIMLPQEVRDDREFSALMEALEPGDLVAGSVGGEPPRYVSGEVVPPEDLIDFARFIDVGPGRYMLDMSDDESGMLEGSGRDGFYVLDVNEILPEIRERRGVRLRGGPSPGREGTGR